MPVSSNALKCLPACKNQLCDNMIDKDFEESGDDEYGPQREKMSLQTKF